MIKAWNRNIGRQFQSFHLEVLAYHILKGVTISDFPSGMRYFFDKGRELIARENPDPAGYSGNVGYYINTQEKVKVAVEKFMLAHDRAVKAEDYARRGGAQTAIEKWIQVFGDYFPAYG